MSGKAYANKKPTREQPQGNFYPTPKSLVWVARPVIRQHFDIDKTVLEPCCGNGAISDELVKMGYHVIANDLYATRPQYSRRDYLSTPYQHEYVITNPPFSLWDEFVVKAKSEARKIMFIGRLNYFGTNSRLKNGIWNNLRAVYCFNRYIDYRTPERKDGHFHVGAMATAWFLWDMDYAGHPEIHFLDVQKYATLGNK